MSLASAPSYGVAKFHEYVYSEITPGQNHLLNERSFSIIAAL
jgi:hypothetical protein